MEPRKLYSEAIQLSHENISPLTRSIRSEYRIQNCFFEVGNVILPQPLPNHEIKGSHYHYCNK